MASRSFSFLDTQTHNENNENPDCFIYVVLFGNDPAIITVSVKSCKGISRAVGADMFRSLPANFNLLDSTLGFLTTDGVADIFRNLSANGNLLDSLGFKADVFDRLRCF